MADLHGPWEKNTIYELTVLATALGQRIVNVHHFEATAVGDVTPAGDASRLTLCQTLIDSWQAAALTTWRACHNAQYVINTVKAQVVQVKTHIDRVLVPVEETMTTGNAGTDAATQADDMAAAALLKWKSSVAGKSHRGRTYIGPLPQTWSQDGMLQTSGLTACNAYGNAMISTYGVTAGSSLDFRLTVYSRPCDKGEYGYVTGSGSLRQFFYPEARDGDSTNVVNFTTDPILRTQRRRVIGVGS